MTNCMVISRWELTSSIDRCAHEQAVQASIQNMSEGRNVRARPRSPDSDDDMDVVWILE